MWVDRRLAAFRDPVTVKKQEISVFLWFDRGFLWFDRSFWPGVCCLTVGFLWFDRGFSILTSPTPFSATV